MRVLWQSKHGQRPPSHHCHQLLLLLLLADALAVTLYSRVAM
jgi:hypothetical protein